MEQLYTVSRVAEALGVARQTVHHHVAQGNITVHSVTGHGHYRFDDAEVERLRQHLATYHRALENDYVNTLALARRLGVRTGLLTRWVKEGKLEAKRHQGSYVWSIEQQAAAEAMVMARVDELGPTPGRAKPERNLQEDVQSCTEAEWRRYGFELVAQRQRKPHCERAHPVVPVLVGIQRGWMCGVCNRVYLTGKRVDLVLDALHDGDAA